MTNWTRAAGASFLTVTRSLPLPVLAPFDQRAGPSRVMQGIKLVIFDIAGTVIEDAGQVPAAFTAALGNYGIEIKSDSIREVRGASKREVIQRFVERQPGIRNADINNLTEEIYNT